MAILSPTLLFLFGFVKFWGGGGLLKQNKPCKLACNVAKHRSHTKSAVMYCVQAHVSKIKFDCSVCYCRTFSGVRVVNTFQVCSLWATPTGPIIGFSSARELQNLHPPSSSSSSSCKLLDIFSSFLQKLAKFWFDCRLTVCEQLPGASQTFSTVSVAFHALLGLNISCPDLVVLFH